jgi:PAS domain S-box-containing protein
MSGQTLQFRSGLHTATVHHLARRLSEAEISLTTLTGGALDAILDRTGHPFLLRAAQERFREDESRVRVVLDSVPDVIIAINHSGKVLFQSAAAARILGYEPEELVGRNMFEFVHREDVRQLYHVVSGAIEEFTANATVDFQLLARDGSWRMFEAGIGRLIDPAASPGLILILRDPGARRQDQEDAVRDKTVLEIKRFLARLARELQTPVTLALMGVEAMENVPSAHAKPTLDMIRSNLERQSRLLKELLDFSAAKNHALAEEKATDTFSQ